MHDRLGDYVQDGNPREFKKQVDKVVKKAKFINRWVKENTPRSDRSLALSNLLKAVSDNLEILKSSLDSHISILALATRSQYEINIRLRSVIKSDSELMKWSSEAITDKVQTLEGILSLDSDVDNIKARSILNSEILRLKSLAVKYSLPEVKNPASAGNIAGSLGLEAEHKALFKMFSKLVHPSSYLVNDLSRPYGNV
jgi:hypothetical protein